MGISTFPAAVGGDATGGNRNFKATAAGTYAVDIPAGVYDAQSQGVTDPIIIGSESWDGASKRFYFDTEQTTVIFPVNIELNTANWTTRNSTFGTNTVVAPAYGNGIYLAIGANSRTAISTNGITWTSTPNNGLGFARTLTFGNGLFIGAGDGGGIRTTTDGAVWAASGTTGVSTIRASTFGAGIYVIGGDSGQLSTSTDGNTWTTRTSGFGSTGIAALHFGGGVFLAGGPNYLTTSTNGITWTSRTANANGNQIQAITSGLAGGDTRLVIALSNGGIRTSDDITTWTTRTSATTASINGLAFGNGNFVSSGGSGIITTSTDAVTWTLRSVGFTNQLEQVAYGDNGFVVGGSQGLIATSLFETLPFGEQYIALEYKGEITEFV